MPVRQRVLRKRARGGSDRITSENVPSLNLAYTKNATPFDGRNFNDFRGPVDGGAARRVGLA